MEDSKVNHVAIIMDGNGRWATTKGLSRNEGHMKGAEVVKDIVRAAADMEIPYLTLFAFSSENWGRPEDEVAGLMNLIRRYLKEEFSRMKEEGARLMVIGDRARLPDDIQESIGKAEQDSKDNTRITVQIALSYGGRNEIMEACRNIASRVKSGEISPEDITLQMISDNLYTAGIPDPDIVIRTSGEHRISNFLLWQMSYSEMFFPAKHWPDFTADDLASIIEEFKKRNRRFGKVSGKG